MQMKLKRAGILLRYYLHNCRRQFINWLGTALFLFAVSAIVALVVVSHPRLAQILAQRPQSLTLYGFVYMPDQSSQDIFDRPTPASGATVEVGGFATTTDSSGYYILRFRSQNTQGIPTVICHDSIQGIERVSFSSDERELHRDFLLDP